MFSFFVNSNSQLTELSKIILWVFSSVIVIRIIEFFFETPELNILIIILFAFALYLLSSMPLQKLGVSQAVEIGLAAVAIIIFTLHIGFTVIAPKMRSAEIDDQPCGKNTAEFQCYNFTHDACLSAWSHYESQCREEAKANQQSPSQLLGAGVKQCIRKKFLQYMSYNRKSNGGILCQ